MENSKTPAIRFREARERAGLSHQDLAHETGVCSASIWDIEMCDSDLCTCYSPTEPKRLCEAMKVRPVEIFSDNFSGHPISAAELVEVIHKECRARGVTLEEFEDAVGWYLSKCIEPPERLLEDLAIDGLQWLCRELRIDWKLVLLGL